LHHLPLSSPDKAAAGWLLPAESSPARALGGVFFWSLTQARTGMGASGSIPYSSLLEKHMRNARTLCGLIIGLLGVSAGHAAEYPIDITTDLEVKFYVVEKGGSADYPTP
jgi:hypothetical protein